MKFSDGFWQMQPGYVPHAALQIHEVETGSGALTVYAATRRLAGRGDTLGQPLLTVRYSSPLENVIRVQLVHHKGSGPKKPGFELDERSVPEMVIRDSANWASLTSGELTVRVSKGEDWLVEYRTADGLLTSSAKRALGYVDTPSGRFVHEQLSLGVGELVYGLGERFGALVKNGQSVDMWNEDGGTSSEQAYKNIPFYMTNHGYGVFVNQPERVSFEVASEKVERVQFSVAGEALEYLIIYGPTPKQILARYTALTGRPALPPAWSFGLWLSTSFTTDYDEQIVTAILDGMAKHDLPLHVFHFDCFWMKEFNWCDFKWNPDTFPDPPGMLQRLKERGLHICVWINPYIAQRSPLFEEGMRDGYLLRKPDGSIWQTDQWQAGMGMVDFTNPAACEWFGEKLRAVLDLGVDAFKTDFGERIPTDVVYADGSDPFRMHNYYTYLYNRTVFKVLSEVRGEGEAILFARSATTGGQQFPVHWGGDSTATFESMAESLRGGLALGMSGFGFWSHDIGGFEQTASADVYKRWCAFGLLSSHSRLHGSRSYRVPWLFGEEAVDVLRFFTRLKCALMPYLFAAAVEAHQRGTPLLRSMFLEFPDDPGCEYLDRQYMLGPDLLVAPVFAHDGQVRYYVPAGRWTHFLSNRPVVGPGWVTEKYDFMSLPLLVRPNSVIPVGAETNRPDYAYGDGVTLQVYSLQDGVVAMTEIPSLDGKTGLRFEVLSQDGVIAVTRRGSSKNWKVLLVGIHKIRGVEGGKSETVLQGTLITAVGPVRNLQILVD